MLYYMLYRVLQHFLNKSNVYTLQQIHNKKHNNSNLHNNYCIKKTKGQQQIRNILKCQDVSQLLG